ncbi:M56 family metallopeptidase [Amycolatopsis sp. CA-128772]|uniref:M56 family metallopeptidase n=1 Tax=Amycolatopsis sp. CA-128772 TaxID=2073159 RepID=UPI000CD29194|nr:M56 family metallopeptidase [Amycolatopsis sp. CA-128772]
MDLDAWVPLAAWPLARAVAPHLPPRAASWLLTGGCLVLALASTATLAFQAVAGLALLTPIARAGHWSPDTIRNLESTSVPMAVVSGILLLVLSVTGTLTVVRYVRWLRELTREIDRHQPGPGVVVLPEDEPVAFAAPGRGGRIAVSHGMLHALDTREREALLAHEKAHLRLRHHYFFAAISISGVLNPLLRPLSAAAAFALERWADEAAARHVGDRTLVATAVAKAALAGRTRPGFALAATGGPVPRRVTALLDTPARQLPAALLSGLLILGVTVWSARTTLDGATDLHTGIETAHAGADRHAH